MNIGIQLIRLYRLSVWDAQGRQYLPVMAYNRTEITHYAPALDALDAFWDDQVQFTLTGVV